MIKLFYHKEFFTNWSSELVLLYSDLNKKIKIQDNRFKSITNNMFDYVDNIEHCDFVVLPYKWRGFDNITNTIIKDCEINNKTLLVFYNDDDSKPIRLKNSLIFRTSMFGETKCSNEFGLTPFFDDYFDNDIMDINNISLSIGFCGYDHFERKFCLSKLVNNKEIKTDFIVRKSFWAKEVDENKAIEDFNSNLKNNLFNFCARGSGNFSYRFFQTLSMGRIPLLLNTDCVLQFYDLINYEKHCLIVDLENIDKVDNLLVEYYLNKDKNELFQLQKDNRILYENCLSPNGFLNMLYKTLRK